jgi:hypothetical protein
MFCLGCLRYKNCRAVNYKFLILMFCELFMTIARKCLKTTVNDKSIIMDLMAISILLKMIQLNLWFVPD